MVFVKKKIGLKFPRQLTAEVFLGSLLSKFSSVVNCNRFHNSAVNYRGHFRLLHVFFNQTKCVNNNFPMKLHNVNQSTPYIKLFC